MGQQFRMHRVEAKIMKTVITTGCLAGLLMNSQTSGACPAFVNANSLPAAVTESGPETIRLFKITKKQTGLNWSPLAMQIDPLTKEGVIDNKRASTPGTFAIRPDDRFVFETKSFGERYDQKTQLPCQISNITELESLEQPPAERFAYLITCKNKETLARSMGPLVTHDPNTQRVNTERFIYEYQPTNQLLFRSLTAHLPNGKDVVAGQNSDFILHLDLKRFFTMNFGNKNVESYVETTHSGDVGVNAVVNFYLKILLFKVDLKMATMASFFRDSANIPMIVDVPLQASKHLNPGSGILYAFKPVDTKFNLSPGEFSVPIANPELIKKGYEELAKTSQTTCTGDSCYYRVKGTVDSKTFNLDILIPRHAVQQGFYPQLVTNVAAFKKEMGWRGITSEDEGLFGFYYENSGLNKGRFTMNYWIGFTDSPSNITCPSPVAVKDTISGQDIVDIQAAKENPTH